MCSCDEPKGEARLAVPGAPQFDMADKTELVALGLRPNAGLNQQVVLPRGISAAEGINRTLMINAADQLVPTSAREWMIADPRYQGWFSGIEITPSPVGPAAGAVSSTVDGVPLGGAAVNPPADSGTTDTPLTNPAKTEGDDGEKKPHVPPELAWNRNQTVPVLRDYAKQFGVEILSSDNKEEIVGKLLKERGQFEVADEEAPKA